MRKLRYALEALLAAMLLLIFRLLPLDWASALGGWIGRTFGPHLNVSDVARRNLTFALPELDETAREEAVRGMWDNLGRVVGEFPHLGRPALMKRITLHGTEVLHQGGLDGAIFISGHLGNWELNGLTAFREQVPLSLVYRPANNPWVEWLMCRIRGRFTTALLGKGTPGDAVRMARTLHAKKPLGMLVDQKMNNGLAIPFFGKDAMTAPAVAQLAMKYRCPVIPARVVRRKGVFFDMYMEPPLAIPDSGNKEEDVRELLETINATLERWIRETPQQWFWVHRRWPKGTI